MLLATESSFPLYTDIKTGLPLDGGYLYFGVPNNNPETTALPVYWDAAGAQQAAQPIRTLNGYPVRNGTPALLFIDGDYSITVRDHRGRFQWTLSTASSANNSASILAQLTTFITSLASQIGSSLIGFIQGGAGAKARTMQSKARDILDIDDYCDVAYTGPQNSTAVGQILTYALANGYDEVRVEKNYSFDFAAVPPATRTLLPFVGAGSVGGLYRKSVTTNRAPQFQPSTDINPARHLRNLARTAAPVVVMMGDSIASEGPDAQASTVSMWSVIKERMQDQNPDKAFTFYNRAIGGQTWLNANSTPSAFPSWYTVPANSWLSYVQTLAPDVLFLAFGMNDANGFNSGGLTGALATINGWAKVPDIIFVTNPVPALSALYPDGSGTGFVAQVFQEGRDYVAGYERTYARQRGYGLLDINRMFVASRDGYDTQSGILKLIETVAATAYTAVAAAKDFAFACVCTGIWTEGRVLKIKCGLGANDAIFITKTGGNFVVSGFTDAVGTYKTVATGVTIPATPFYFEVSVFGDIARVLIDSTTTGYNGLGKTVIAEFQTIRYGGIHSPLMEWQATPGSGPFSSITYLAGYGDQKYKQTATDSDIFSTSDNTSAMKTPYGGNGINHYSARGVEMIVRPVVEAADFRSTQPVLDQIDIVLGTNTTAVSAFAQAERVGRMVRLTGTIKNTVVAPGANDVIFTVPLGFRPRRDGIRFGGPAGPLFRHITAGQFACDVGPISALYALDNIVYFID